MITNELWHKYTHSDTRIPSSQLIVPRTPERRNRSNDMIFPVDHIFVKFSISNEMMSFVICKSMNLYPTIYEKTKIGLIERHYDHDFVFNSIDFDIHFWFCRPIRYLIGLHEKNDRIKKLTIYKITSKSMSRIYHRPNTQRLNLSQLHLLDIYGIEIHESVSK